MRNAWSSVGVTGACQSYLVASGGLAGSEGCDAFSLARDSSTRFLKSPASSCITPRKADSTCISQPVPCGSRCVEIVREWIAPLIYFHLHFYLIRKSGEWIHDGSR